MMKGIKKGERSVTILAWFEEVKASGNFDSLNYEGFRVSKYFNGQSELGFNTAFYNLKKAGKISYPAKKKGRRSGKVENMIKKHEFKYIDQFGHKFDFEAEFGPFSKVDKVIEASEAAGNPAGMAVIRYMSQNESNSYFPMVKQMNPDVDLIKVRVVPKDGSTIKYLTVKK